ncbi:MAG: hypothetical protein A2007_06375 [Verrucomicrobia bacterium GWC2_42_7]|nr:MAG: hypothetical protein A2007_06375 [Verrucomicrobia bacterium GWC2_42_7]
MAEWLLENVIPDSLRSIVVGRVSREEMEGEIKANKGGVFWIVDLEGAKDWVHCGDSPCIFPLDTHPIDALSEHLQSFLSADTKRLPHLKVSPSILTHLTDSYDTALSLLTRITDTTQRIRNAQRLTGDVIAKNLFRNLPLYFSHQLPSTLEAQEKGWGAVIVGAGPSLDVTLPIIKEWLEKGWRPIIIATDSSLKALENIGIDPHFVVEIDPYKTCESCTSSDYARGIGLFSIDCNESWPQRWNQFYILPKNEIIEQFFQKNNIQQASLTASSNAGLTALAFSVWLGSGYSLLIGMDLSTDSNSNLSRYAKITGRPNVLSNRADLFTIPGNFQPQVLTPFLCDWEATAAFCQKQGQTHTIINFNDRGAKLPSTNLIPPEKKDDLYAILENTTAPFDVTTLTYEPASIPQAIANSLYQKLQKNCEKIQKALLPLSKGASSPSSKKEALGKLVCDDDISLIFSSYVYNIMQDLVETAEVPEPTWNQHINILLDLAEFCIASLKDRDL